MDLEIDDRLGACHQMFMDRVGRRWPHVPVCGSSSHKVFRRTGPPKVGSSLQVTHDRRRSAASSAGRSYVPLSVAHVSDSHRPSSTYV